MFFGNLVTAVSLRKCFYLSAIVLITSTLMAAVIIVKLSPLESVKCQPQAATAAVEWSTLASHPTKALIATPETTRESKTEKAEKIYREAQEKIIQEKIAKMARQMRNKVLPLLNSILMVEPNYNVHIFYYAWYRSAEYDGAWRHWNHDILPHWKKTDKRVYPEGSHSPPADIGANYYPNLGCYSSMDPQIIDLHMRQLKETGIGVVVVSWTPPTSNENTDSIMPDLLDAAHRYQLKVAPHIEPYEGRNPINLMGHLRYLLTQYGSHPALYRLKRESDGAILPVMYIYDSYVFPSSAWWELLSQRGNLTLRGTELDAIYIGLLVDAQHKNHIKKSHFDGFYTYFGINGFSYGSSWKNWRDLNKFANQNGLLFIPSLGPGYIDTQLHCMVILNLDYKHSATLSPLTVMDITYTEARLYLSVVSLSQYEENCREPFHVPWFILWIYIRPWNAENTRHRRHGQYYEFAWRTAVNSGASIISITSFNEWHEGTQIEPAKPVSNRDFTYLDYEPEGPDFYLNLTKWWVQQFSDKIGAANSALS